MESHLLSPKVRSYVCSVETALEKAPKRVMVSAEPGDGRGGSDDPLPPNGFMNITGWNYSDKWCYVVNEVAKDYLDNL